MTHSFRSVLLVQLGAVCLAGCGTQYSLQTFSPLDKGPKSAFVDIKQRAVLASARPASAAGGGAGDVVMCAEPSPDALSSFASELGLDVKAKDAVAAQFTLSQQEAASFVGLRTQSIQLLRDGMFRLCEGYMAGALTQPDFAWLSRRYQKNMVALLTIEQLTRVAQVPAFAQLSQGMASASRSATAIQSDLEEIDAKRTALESEKKAIDAELAEAQKLPDTDKDKAKKVAEITQRQADKQAALTRTTDIRSALLEGLKTAKGLLTSGSTTVQVIADGRDGRGSPTDTVAKAIADITNNVILQDDLGTLCFQLLAGERTTRDPTRLAENCAKIVETRAALDAALLKEYTESRSKAAQAAKAGTDDAINELRTTTGRLERQFLSNQVQGDLAERLANNFGRLRLGASAPSGSPSTAPKATAKAASAPAVKAAGPAASAASAPGK